MDYASVNNLYLCIDQGGHASRVLVFDQQGDLVTQAFQDIEAQHTAQGYIEYDAAELLSSIQTPLRTVLTELDDRLHDIKAAGLATQRSNVVCWDNDSGEALSPIISWQDRRGAAQLPPLKAHAELIQVAQKEGISVDEAKARREASIPVRRYGTSEEFGATCAFLCSVHAGFIVGQNLLHDGGGVNSTL